jgi:hypothetical protein
MQQKREYFIDALHIFTLVSLAFAQPLYVLSRNAEFFIAHSSAPIDIIFLILCLYVLLPLVLIGVEVIAGLVGRKYRKGFHYFFIASLLACIALVLLNKYAGNFSGTTVVVGSVVFGILATFAYIRFQEIRKFITILFPAIFIFPYLFLFDSPVNKVVFPEKDPLAVAVKVEDPVPIVMVVFDEFPVTSLMDEQRGIDPVRYPNFAALARDAYWFRNATTVSDLTHFAVPSILTGKYPIKNKVPTSTDYPDNIFTLLGNSYKLKVFETITQLCPDQLCSRRLDNNKLSKRIHLLLTDAIFIILHVLLPPDLTDGLPVITQTWKDFSTDNDDYSGDIKNESKTFVVGMFTIARAGGKKRQSNRIEEFRNFLDSIHTTHMPTFYFQHIFLPHIPWQFFPSGQQYGVNVQVEGLEVKSEKWADNELLIMQGFKRHLLQVGFVDKLLGELIERLKAVGIYDRSLIIITTDHGVSFQNEGNRRFLSKNNYQDIMPVPLLIKLPGQRRGMISDRNVETIDILPTIADVINIQIPWPVDGRSVFERSLPERKEKIIFAEYNVGEKFIFEPYLENKYKTLNKMLAMFGSGTTRPDGLFKNGPHSELIGRHVSEVGVTGNTSITIEIEHANLFANINLESNFLPSVIRGNVNASQKLVLPLNLAISINDKIRAITQTFKDEKGDVKFATLVPENSFQAGNNVVEVFTVSEINGIKRLKRARNKSVLTYTLTVSDKKGETITSSEGQVFKVEQGAVRGRVDRVYGSGKILGFRGWAADVNNLELPEAVIVFLNGEFIYKGNTGVQREDIPEAFGSAALLRSGFEFILPMTSLNDPSIMDIRFFALSKEGDASELSYPEWWYNRIKNKDYNQNKRIDSGLLRYEKDLPVNTYTLTQSGTQKEMITSPEGKSVQIIADALKGALDVVSVQGDYIHVSGWAVDMENEQLPGVIVIFVDNNFFYEGSLNVERLDIAKAFDDEKMKKSGFQYSFPVSRFNAEPTEARIFAISQRGIAAELGYPEGYKWGKK